ncbi:MAG: cupin domain-containing protein [Nitrospinota bacterium]
MKVVRKDDAPRPDSQGRDHFTRPVGMAKLLGVDEPAPVRVYSVAFEPGARTFWHAHPGGQILYVVKGKGRVQTWEDQARNKKAEIIGPGDVVHIPPGVKHWHGADPASPMEHIAFSMGGDTDWMEEVSEEDYAKASSP